MSAVRARIHGIVLSLVLFSGFLTVPLRTFAEVEITSVISRIGPYPLTEYTPLGEVHELKNRQIENQQQSEECYLFAFTNYLQVANRNIYERPSAPGISGPYLFAVKLLEYIDQSFDLEDPHFLLEGGNIPDAIELIVKHGLIPDSAWHPEVPFHYWPFETLYKNLQAQIKIQKKILKQTAAVTGENSKEFRSALDAARSAVKETVWSLTGKLPTHFQWNNRLWTPKQFASVYGIKQARSVELYHPQNIPLFADESYLRKNMRQLLDPFGAQFSIYPRDWDSLENKMMAAIDRGVPVPVGVNWGRSGGHVLTAIGYELRHGKVFAWKFLNSWGRWSPDGAAFYKASDFRNKADQIWIIE